jgi:hypothetical protein
MIIRHGHEPHQKNRRAVGLEILGPLAAKYSKLDALPEGVEIYRNADGAVVVREALVATSVNPEPGYTETIVSAKNDSATAWYMRFLKKGDRK